MRVLQLIKDIGEVWYRNVWYREAWVLLLMMMRLGSDWHRGHRSSAHSSTCTCCGGFFAFLHRCRVKGCWDTEKQSSQWAVQQKAKGKSRKRNEAELYLALMGGLTKVSLKGAFEVCVELLGVSFCWTREAWLCLDAEHKSPLFPLIGEVITCLGIFFVMLMLAFWMFFYAACVCVSVYDGSV